MALTRVECPNCQAGLKSSAGFTVGQKIRCPKCQTVFVVPEELDQLDELPDNAAQPPATSAQKRRVNTADDDQGDDVPSRPKKSRKKRKTSGYRNSPLRFAILGGLLIVLAVLSVMLYQKKQREKTSNVITTETINE